MGAVPTRLPIAHPPPPPTLSAKAAGNQLSDGHASWAQDFTAQMFKSHLIWPPALLSCEEVNTEAVISPRSNNNIFPLPCSMDLAQETSAHHLLITLTS